MIPHDYQIKYAKQGAAVVRKYMMFYLAWEERTRKTLTSILICEELRVNKILVITKKKPLVGWLSTFKLFKHTKDYTVTTYTQLHKLKGRFDLVILDESHNFISSFPKVSKTWSLVKRFTKDVPIIYISATPYAQGYQQLYNQFALSSWNPWVAWNDPEDWFDTFGIPHKVYIQPGIKRESYTKVKDECFTYVKHLFHTKTRQELGFKYEPVDQVHEIVLKDITKSVYNYVAKNRAATINGWDLVCDSVMKLRTSLHSIEGGTMIVTAKDGAGKKAKLKKNYIQLGNSEKVDYIKKVWGDTKDMVIMYHYIAEKTKLEEAFKKATILQATSNAEGIELYEFKHLIVYSQDFSTARHTQRRARQASRDRDSRIIVHFLLVPKAISSQVYKTVSINKENYVDRLYSRELL